MSWLFSQALVEEYSGGNSSGGEPSAPLNVMPTPHKFSRNGKTMEPSKLSRFGLKCAVLTADRGAELLTSYLAGFPAPPSVPPAMGPDLTEQSPDSGKSKLESFAKWSRSSRGWKTHPSSRGVACTRYSGTWPQWGSMRNGVVSRRKMPSGLTGLRQWITSGNASGLSELTPRDLPSPPAWVPCNGCEEFWCSVHNQHAWECDCPPIDEWDVDPYTTGGIPIGPSSVPTMTCNDAKNSNPPSQRKRNTPPLNVVVGGSVNPTWAEWLMGWPIGWTDLKPLEMGRFRQWYRSHGGC